MEPEIKSRTALKELISLLQEVDERWSGPEWSSVPGWTQINDVTDASSEGTSITTTLALVSATGPASRGDTGDDG